MILFILRKISKHHTLIAIMATITPKRGFSVEAVAEGWPALFSKEFCSICTEKLDAAIERKTRPDLSVDNATQWRRFIERPHQLLLYVFCVSLFSYLHKGSKTFYIRAFACLYMNTEGENVPTRVGPVPLGGYLSYQLTPTEGNFKVACSVNLSKQRNSDSVPITIYPSFPLSLVFPLFNVTQCPSEHH